MVRHKNHNNKFCRSSTPLRTAVLYNYITIQELQAYSDQNIWLIFLKIICVLRSR